MVSRIEPRRTKPRAGHRAGAPRSRLSLTPTRLWVATFAVWGLLLSGLLEDFTGSPGILQYSRLNHLLELKRADLDRAELDLAAMQQEREALDGNPAFLEREVRRVLGYVAPDELVFDFSAE